MRSAFNLNTILKSPAAYYLLLLYMTVLLKPLLPAVSDWWGHQFGELEHLALIHARYGSHHLQKELADAASSTDPAQKESGSRLEDIIPVHLLPRPVSCPFTDCSGLLFYDSYPSSHPPAVLLSIQGPPPKFC